MLQVSTVRDISLLSLVESVSYIYDHRCSGACSQAGAKKIEAKAKRFSGNFSFHLIESCLQYIIWQMPISVAGTRPIQKGTVDPTHWSNYFCHTISSATLWGINGQLPSYCNNVINTRKQMANIQEQGHGLIMMPSNSQKNLKKPLTLKFQVYPQVWGVWVFYPFIFHEESPLFYFSWKICFQQVTFDDARDIV